MFIYLHGFNSSGASAKGRYLAAALAPAMVHTPSYSPDPETAIHTLSHLLCDVRGASPVLIGSSLGGFYAQYLARRFQLANVLINPALQPRQTLRPYLGWQTNYYTGARYFFGEQQLQALAQYEIVAPCAEPVPSLILLAAGDEIIDYRVAATRYADCARVIVYPDGNHQFVHLFEAATEIRVFQAKIANKSSYLT